MMRKNLSLCLALVTLAGCGNSNEDAVRHLVIAEVIQRESVPETRVQVVEVRFNGEDYATVRVRILDPQPRRRAAQDLGLRGREERRAMGSR